MTQTISPPQTLVQVNQHQQPQQAGMLPSPTDLAEYNKVLPDAAKRLFSFAEKEQDERHSHTKSIVAAQKDLQSKTLELQEKDLESQIVQRTRDHRYRILTLMSATLIAICALGVTVIAVQKGQQLPATASGIAPVLSIFYMIFNLVKSGKQTPKP